ncbi:iron-containing alcohol dehydrogenase (plasmid) [Rhizobium leguminosarum bv. trifolii WSM2304]|uniref:Iron-containing alcohol dehydrogenase n=1 Tax=Rhizobium leguminosarum bv. trifolii (strain WSM2304) TaxID=395492 RepID=A0ABF7QXV4_RHILW|nr:maleylacetate reductase [Rhizobium leguminosarum]ACI58902.1 iron-containing alcohol dehydrogenase [Rhizobium leguminosarum bv. trifolii WSM2304]
MVAPFRYTVGAAQIIFGRGSLSRLAEAIAGQGGTRALILSTQHQKAEAERIAASLGPLAAGLFADAAMHTPVDVTERAMAAYNRAGADCVVAIGGGSTIGLGKAIAYRNDAPQIVVATTYAGSEVTPILGQTENGQKTTVRGPGILPEVVIYDPELTLGLPVNISVSSGLNAMAHAVEGLYAQDRNPISSMMAIEGLHALKQALPQIVNTPGDIESRSEALYGSWLCGTVLGAVGMALHHKLCHTLGGSFDLPHAETHAVILPHSAAYNAVAATDALKPAADLFGGSLGGGLYDFAASIGAPMRLRDLGMKEADLHPAAELAARNPYWNPRPIERDAIRALLQSAWEGARPR